MKKCICRLMVLAVMLLAVCCEAFADVAINAANFPDANFRSYVSSNYDVNHNGTLSDAEIVKGIYMFVQNQNITSLQGIEYFTALTHLECSSNQLTALDVSNNTALTNLHCEDNQLTSLDVSHNTALTQLRCYSNHLTALDVSNNTALYYLDCHNNQLTTLALSNNTALSTLRCDFIINNEDNNFTFNIADFMKAYKPLDSGLLYVDFRYFYSDGSEYSSLTTLDQDTINANNVVNFSIPSGKTFSCIGMTLTYSNSQNKKITVYPYSGSSSGTDTPSSTTLTAPIITTSSLPSASVDLSYSATLSAIGASPITWTLSSGSLPDGLTLSSSGTISGTPTTTGAFSFTVTAANSSGSNSRLFSVIIPLSAVRAPKITTSSLTDGFANSPYGFQLAASGTTPLTWSLAEGSSLPDGLTLTTSGYIYGTHTSADTTHFTVCAANSAGTDSQDLSLTFSESPSGTRPAILPENPHPAAQGSVYTCQLMASGTPPFTWTLAKEKLPAGLSMNSSGLITGTPTKAAAAKLALTVSNDYGIETRTITLNICKLPEITTKTLKNAAVGKKYSENIKGTGTKPLTWQLEGTLPQGIPLFEADNAKITGTPSLNDTGMVRITLSNPVGEVSKVFTLKVSAVMPKIYPNSLNPATYGKNYSAALKINGTQPVTVLISGDLPEGLTFDTSTNKITGTPTEVCTNRVITVFAVNMGDVTQQTYFLTVKAIAPKITTKQLPNATQGNTYSVALEATGSPTITWTATGLPSGLSMSTTGTISGTPTESGKFTVKVSAANSAKTVRKTYKLKVSAATTQQAMNSQQASEPEYTAQNVSRNGAAINDVNDVDVDVVDNVDVNDVDVNDDVFTGEYSIVAELGRISVDESGMYDFIVTLSDDTHTGKKLLYLAGSSEPSNDDAIAEFYDEAGCGISTVPKNRIITVSMWLRKGIIYTPSIAVKH